MRKIVLVLLAFLILMAFLLWSRLVDSLNNNKFDEVDVESMKSSKIKEPISENDIKQKDKMDLEIKKFYEVEDSLWESSNRKYEDLVKTSNNYIQRYISLFLITSNLVEHQVKDLNEVITIDLEITINGKDLAYLQELSKSGKESTYIKNLSKLDTIFSKIARHKKRSYMENALRYSKSVFAGIIFSALNSSVFYHFLPLLVILIVSYLSYKFVLYNPYVYSVIFLNSLIIWDILNLYWKRIKEIDVDIYVKTMQFREIPEDCYPSNMGWYRRVFSFVLENRCLQYFQNISKNSMEEVSIFKCIVDTYSFYLIQTPVRILGASIKDFTGEIGELWPWPFNYFLSIPLAPFFAVIAVFFILILCGKRLRLSFLGAAVELGDVKPSIANERTAITCDRAPKGVRDLRKLRPWTNARLPKRLDRDSGVRRRLFLKVVKFFPEMPDDVIKNASDFNEKLNTQDSDLKLNDNIIKHN